MIFFTRRYLWLPLLIFVLGGLFLSAAQADRSQSDAQITARDARGAMLIENVGQFAPEARFQMSGRNAQVWLAQDGIWLKLLDPAADIDPDSLADASRVDAVRHGVSVRLSFVGANPDQTLIPYEPRETHISYLIGVDPSGWHTDVPVWSAVRYQGLYDGIDLLLDGGFVSYETDLLSWKLEAQPGTDLSAIRLRIEGADSVRVEGDRIWISTPFSEYSLPALGLTTTEGIAVPGILVEGAVQQTGYQTFEVAVPWTTASTPESGDSPTLTSDLVYSTYLGGSSWESGYGINIDQSGSAYLTGRTPSPDFPTTTGAFTTTVNAVDMFVTKFNPQGSDLVYSTYIGGSGEDTGWSIVVESGVAYLAGETWSDDFPLAGGVAGENDAVVLALNENGTDLVYATLLGGTDQDVGYAVDVESGQAFVTGITYSDDFPATGYNNNGDIFLSKVDAAGGVLYSTLVGGRNEDAGFSIAVRDGQAYITGQTWSPDFPAEGFLGEDDAFVLKFNTSGELIDQKLVGGIDQDSANDITLDVDGVIYITGETKSSDFPVTEGVPAGDFDAFLVKMDSALAIQYGTYLGGTGRDEGRGVALDRYGGIVVGGLTVSSNFPVTSDAYQTTIGGSYDAFATRYDLAGSDPGHRVYSSFLGGSGLDRGNDMALDPVGYAFLGGYTQSSNFPVTTGAYATSLNGSQDAFVSKLLVSPFPEIAIEKYTNGVDADDAPGPYIYVGEPVSWTYEVSNTGTLDLTNVSVSDDQGLTVNCPQTTLLVNESMTCTASGTAEAGQYANLGSASGTPPIGSDVSDSDPSHYYGSNPHISLVKKINDQDANSPPGVYLLVGDPINWTYEVSNGGNVDLANVTVVDDNGTPSNDADDFTVCTIAALPVGDTQTCSISGTATPGQYVNTATATGAPPADLASVSDSDASHYFGADPLLDLQKRTNGEDADAAPGPYLLVGDTVTWTYEAINQGNTELTNVTIVDDSGTPGDAVDDVTVCVIDTLNVGESQTCTHSGTVFIGQYGNQATGTAFAPVGPNVSATDPSHYFGIDPVITLQKSTNAQDADLAPGPYILVGDAVAWTYEVSNQGNVELTDVSVLDDRGTPSDPADDFTVCTFPSLAVDETQTCTIESSAASGQYANLGSATGTPPVGPDVSDSDPSHYFGSQPDISLQKRTNDQDADSAPGPYILSGNTVTWEYQVSNTGNVELTSVTVIDDNGTPGNPNDDVTVCTIASLGAGVSQTCTRSGTALVGQYGNVGSVSGTPPVGDAKTASDTSHYFGASPGISLQKSTNGEDADSAPGPYILISEPVSWSYQISNTGNVGLTGVTVTDDNGTPTNPADDITVCTIANLGAGSDQTCTRSGTAAAGQYANLGSVSGTPPVGPDVTDSDPSHHYGATAGLDLVKKTNGQDADSAPGPYILVGNSVNWAYDVSNTGEVALSDVTITDDNGTPSNPADDITVCTITTLSVDATRSCTRSGTSTAGQYANLGSASGFYSTTEISAADASHYYGTQALIRLEKSTNGLDADILPGPYILVGDDVNWTYQVFNDGNVDLSDVIIVDDNGTPSNTTDDVTVCSIPSLGVGTSQSCAHLGTAAAGQYANQGKATGTPPGGLADISASAPSHYFGADPKIGLQKLTNDQDADSAPGPYILVGDPLSWTYQVSNQGNVELTDITVTDDNGTPFNTGDDITVCTIASLGAGSDQTCTRSGTAAAGQYANLGSVFGTPPIGVDVSASDSSHYFGSQPDVSLQKSTNGDGADSAPGPYILSGDTVTWEYQVSNNGNVEISAVTVTDDNGTPTNPADDITVCTIASLGVGSDQTCSRSGTAAVGQYANLGSVSGTPPVGPDVSDSDSSHYFGASPAVVLGKSTNSDDADSAPGPYILIGEPVSWSYQVSNTGNVGLTGVTITDDNGTPTNPADDITVCTIANLGAGSDQTCTRSGTAAAGQYANLGSVSGTPPVGPDVSDSDHSHYYGATAGLDLVKKTNGQDADSAPGPYILVGNSVNWAYDVTNTGEVALSDVTITDDNGTPSNLADDITVCTITSLSVSATRSCTRSGTSTAGQYANLGSVSGFYAGTEVSNSDPSHYFGADPLIGLQKFTNDQDADSAPGPYVLVGEPLSWEYQVSNQGNVDLTDVTVTDDNGTPSNTGDDITVCTIPSLPAGETQTCSLDSTAAAGQYANQGKAKGTPPDGLADISASDPSHYFGADPQIGLQKLTNDQDADSAPGPYILVGDPLSWTYQVSNQGNVELTNVTVTDDNGTPSNSADDITVCTITSLAIGETQNCSLSGTAISGQYSNQGTASGTPPGGLSDISDTDPSHYYGLQPALSLDKKTNGQDANEPPGPGILEGGAVEWTYEVSNTGNVSLSNLAVIDDNGTPSDLTDDKTICTVASLAVTMSEICTDSGLASAGQYENNATATGTPPGGFAQVSVSDNSHYFGESPSISIDKKTNGQDADSPPGPTILVGNAVDWTYAVTNDGNVTLSDIIVTDDNGTPANSSDDFTVCTIPTLGAGGSFTCSHSGTSQEGQYANVAAATGTPSQGPDVSDSDPSHYYGAPPGIRIIKYTNSEDANDPPGPYLSIDDPVNWTYEVINTGEVDMLDITVTDDNGTPDNPGDDIAVCSLTSLAPSLSETCSLDGTAREGQYTNIATASGTPQGGSPLSASDASHYFGVSPAISLVKKTNGEDANTTPGPYIPVGGAVSWSYVVTNTGNVALSSVTVVDDNGTPSNPGDDVTICVIGSLAAAASHTCTLSSMAAAGQYANMGTVTGTPPIGSDVSDSDASHYFGADVVLNLSKKTNDQDAENPPGPYVLVGGTVDWTYEISNNGNVDLTDITITDDNGTPDNDTDDVTVCTISSLAVGASDSCGNSGTAVAGQYKNQALASAVPPGGLESITVTDVSHYFGADPQATIEKKTNNQDADSAPGPYILVGDAVSWTYEIKNTGNVSLSGVTVIDDSGTPGNAADDVTVCTIAELGAGVTQSCSLIGTAGTGQYENIATVTATPPGGLADVSSSDPSHYFGADPLIDLVKKTNGVDANDAPGPSINVGDAVNWDYEVTNTGNISLSDVRVTDDQGVTVSCPQSSLDVGEKITCTASGIAVLGQYTNIGTALGTPPGGLNDVGDNDPSHYYGANPSLLVVKKTNGEDANQPPGLYIHAGDDVTWTYVVTNSGNVGITDVKVSDDNGTPSNTGDDYTVCTIASLPVDGSEQCTWTGTAIEGQYANTATVTGRTTEGSQASDTDTSHYFGSQPEVSLQKMTNGEDADTAPGPSVVVGEAVTWTYEVSNTGNVALSDVTITDDNGTPSDPSDDVTVCIISNLPTSNTQSCTRTGTAVPGQYENQGTVTANPPGSLTPVNDSDLSHYFGAKPEIEIIKSTAGQEANQPPGPFILVGDPVTWQYQVTNTGNVALSDISVADDSGTPDDPGDDVTVCSIASLDVAEQQSCSLNGTAAEGQYANVGKATGTPTVGEPVTDTDISHYFGAQPAITLVKSTNGQDADSAPGPYILVGNAVNWKYVVSNTGNVALSDVTIKDDNGTPGDPADDVTVCTIAVLDVGTQSTCNLSGTAAVGQYANLGTATASPPNSLPQVSDTDTSHYFGANPALSLVKKTNGQDANEPPGPNIVVGKEVSWTYEVSNTGNVTLSNISVLDDQGVDVSCPGDSLPSGEGMICTASGTAVIGQYANTGTATGTPPEGLPEVSDSDPSHYTGISPNLTIVKKTNDEDANSPPGPYIPVGDAVTWTYDVSNAGDVVLTDITVTDDKGTPDNTVDDVTVCTLPSLAVDETQQCFLAGTAVAGQYENIGSVTGVTQESTPVDDYDLSHYFGAQPEISLQKKTNAEDADAAPGPYILVGDSITWTYEVSNTGNVSLSNVTVEDDNGTASDPSDDITVCIINYLVANTTQICTRTGTAAPGQYGNVGSVTGNPPVGLQPVGDSDASHYFGAQPDLGLEKRTNGQDADAAPGPYVLVGEMVDWSYEVSNLGNVALSNVTVIDDSGTPLDDTDDYTVCTISSLAVGVSETCFYSATAAAGQYANQAEATGTLPGGLGAINSLDSSHYFGAEPVLILDKLTNGQDAENQPGPYILVGETIIWQYDIANTGNVDLLNVKITDDNGTPTNPSDDVMVCEIAHLAVGASDRCVLEGEATSGQYGNVATAVGTPPGGLTDVQVSDSSHYFGAIPGISLIKRTNGLDANDPPGPSILVGDPVNWSYEVLNNGNVTLSGVTVVDDQGVSVSCPKTSLVPTDSMTCTANGTAINGQYKNIGTARGTPPGDLSEVADTDASHYLGYVNTPSIDIQKYTNGYDADSTPGPMILIGEALQWEYIITNNGNVDLLDITVSDDNGTPASSGDDILVCSQPSLVAGDSFSCTREGTASTGQYGNLGSVAATIPGGSQINDSDPSHYFGADPDIRIEKRVNGQDADEPPGLYILIGDTVNWSYEVFNDGNVELTGVEVFDDNGTPSYPFDDFSVCTIASLAIGSSQTCVHSDVALAGAFVNVATATGNPPGGLAVVDASDASHYFGSDPSLLLIKRTNGMDANSPPGPSIPVGDNVTWSYLVNNNGNIAIHSITVTDDHGTPDHTSDDFTVCTITNLDPGSSHTCTVVGVAVEGQYVNIGSSFGWAPGDLGEFGDMDISHYLGYQETRYIYLPLVLR